MPDCAEIDRLATPYVDGELRPAERVSLERHLERCPRCHSRVAAERAVRDLLHARQPVLQGPCASAALKARCQAACHLQIATSRWRQSGWLAVHRVVPFATAAVLTLIVGGSFLYVATGRSTTLLAAELTADHMKCFALNAVLRTRQSPAAVQSAMASSFDWPLSLSSDLDREGLDVVGSRLCLYGEGKTAHVMFRHHGRPVSLFMLPRVERPETILGVLGHECAIWSVADRTFVLVAREARADVEKLAAVMKASLD